MIALKTIPDCLLTPICVFSEIDQFCPLNEDARRILTLSVRKLQLSARSYHRVLKLSRTIADLDGAADIQVAHIAEALQYRPPVE